MTFEESLLQQYGPLLSMTELAEILDRSPDGLRISLHTQTPWAKRINRTRLKIGRRVYFRTPEIAELFSNESLD